MDRLAHDYMALFAPEDETTANTYVEGIENCVTKNLFNALFGATGTGQNPTLLSNGETSQNIYDISPEHIGESR